MINVTETALKIIEEILQTHVSGCEVRALGSRQTWTNKDYSDLDLAVAGKGKLPVAVMDGLREAFEESELPYRVDVVDYHAVSREFQEIIDASHEVILDGRKTG